LEIHLMKIACESWRAGTTLCDFLHEFSLLGIWPRRESEESEHNEFFSRSLSDSHAPVCAGILVGWRVSETSRKASSCQFPLEPDHRLTPNQPELSDGYFLSVVEFRMIAVFAVVSSSSEELTAHNFVCDRNMTAIIEADSWRPLNAKNLPAHFPTTISHFLADQRSCAKM